MKTVTPSTSNVVPATQLRYQAYLFGTPNGTVIVRALDHQGRNIRYGQDLPGGDVTTLNRQGLISTPEIEAMAKQVAAHVRNTHQKCADAKAAKRKAYADAGITFSSNPLYLTNPDDFDSYLNFLVKECGCDYEFVRISDSHSQCYMDGKLEAERDEWDYKVSSRDFSDECLVAFSGDRNAVKQAYGIRKKKLKELTELAETYIEKGVLRKFKEITSADWWIKNERTDTTKLFKQLCAAEELADQNR